MGLLSAQDTTMMVEVSSSVFFYFFIILSLLFCLLFFLCFSFFLCPSPHFHRGATMAGNAYDKKHCKTPENGRLFKWYPYSCPPKTQMRPNCGIRGVSLRKVSVFQDKFKGNTLDVVLWGGGATNSLSLELTGGPTFCSSAAMQSHICA